MKEIQSIHNPFIQKIKKLNQKKYRDEEHKFIIEGYHLVTEAYNMHCLETIITSLDDDKIDNYKDVSIIKVSSNIISFLSKTITPQPIIGICSYLNVNEIKGNKLLVLDDISDPGNMGTLIRTALGLYMDGIILSNDCVDIYNEKVIRSSQGAIFKIPFIKCDIKAKLIELKENGYTIYSTGFKNSVMLSHIKPVGKYALILGNEGSGVKEDLLSIANQNITIEMNSLLESYNVAIAGAMIMYYLNYHS